MITRIGGLRIHPESEWQPTLGEWLDDANALVTWLRTALDATVGVRGVAVIPTNMIDRYSLSGPVSRASGVDLDTRRRTAVYDELKWPEVVIEPPGDATHGWQRYVTMRRCRRTYAVRSSTGCRTWTGLWRLVYRPPSRPLGDAPGRL
ncbi:NADH-ubiquinone oxidoreductase [Cutibacterium acnes JCM 18920]|nr:NADH-ubiquinone oxidoreductase [Cutibacterium acnes JCM 18920]